MFLINSPLGSLAAALIAKGRPYLEITVAVLPSSLTKFLSYIWGFSPHLPVSVYGTVAVTLALEVFLVSSATWID